MPDLIHPGSSAHGPGTKVNGYENVKPSRRLEGKRIARNCSKTQFATSSESVLMWTEALVTLPPTPMLNRMMTRPVRVGSLRNPCR